MRATTGSPCITLRTLHLQGQNLDGTGRRGEGWNPGAGEMGPGSGNIPPVLPARADAELDRCPLFSDNVLFSRNHADIDNGIIPRELNA